MNNDDDIETVEEFEDAWGEAEPVETIPIQHFSDELAPLGGWQPSDFPQVTVAPIPYTTNPLIHPDPHISILDSNGWMYIEAGNVRFALPDREEWAKFVRMGEALWNTHEAQQQASKLIFGDPPSENGSSPA